MTTPRTFRLLVSLAAAMVAGAAGAASAEAQADPVTPAEASALGQQAYFYGFPLLDVLRVRATQTSVRCPDTHGNSPVNSFSNLTRFADPSDRTVVAPNVDALYSVAHLDLGKGPVVLRHPDMGNRYFVFQLLDPFTNNVGYIGSRTTGSGTGRFAITWSGHSGNRVPGTETITVDSRRIWILGRTLATDKADQRRALDSMGRYTLTPPGGAQRFPAGCRPGKPDEARVPSGLRFLDRLGQALQRNPPPDADQPLLDQLAEVGVGPGLRPQEAGLDPATLDALVAGTDAIATSLPDGAKATVLALAAAHDGWATPPANIGDYGTDYATRAGVAVLGLGANTPIEAIYPTAYIDGDGQLLDGSNHYRLVLHPDEVPPVRAFWSLTIYNKNGNLIENPIDRYAIGSSHPHLQTRGDGRIVVALQQERPTEKGINWLPTPPGQFRLNLRLYWPKAAALNGAWTPPPIRRIEP